VEELLTSVEYSLLNTNPAWLGPFIESKSQSALHLKLEGTQIIPYRLCNFPHLEQRIMMPAI
jgi:hypothetical protein